MKIEGLKGKRTKQIILVSLVFIGIVVTLVLITSKAKYKNIQSIDLASGTINYTPADIDIVAINVENDAGEYDSVEVIPTSEYVLSNTSYCNVNGSKDNSIILTYENGKVGVSNITKKVKCYLYFEKSKAIDTILGDVSNIKEKTSFSNIGTSKEIYSAIDDYGTSYYFRGSTNNNWVEFAGYYWRIIRINGNGTVRMIYSGEANGNPSSSNKTGETTGIGTSMYNHTYNDNAYVGYMMGIPLNGTEQTRNETTAHSGSYEEAHSNFYDSDVKKEIDIWYKNNIIDKGFSTLIDIETGFCVERNVYSGVSWSNNYGTLGYGTNNTTYTSIARQMQWNGSGTNSYKTTQTLTLQCANKERDLFTTKTAKIGNKALTYPIGMITIDEVIFAGGFGGKANYNYYLNTNSRYWTITPQHFGGDANVLLIHNDSFGHVSVYNTASIRPVINLRADTKFTYNNEATKGSESDPYIVS